MESTSSRKESNQDLRVVSERSRNKIELIGSIQKDNTFSNEELRAKLNLVQESLDLQSDKRQKPPIKKLSKPKINLTYDISIDDSFELDVEDVDDFEGARSEIRDMDMSNLGDQIDHSGRMLHESNSRRISLKTFKLNKLRSIDSKSSADFNSTNQNNLNFSALKIIDNTPKNT